MSAPATPRRPPRPQIVLNVLRTERLTPHLVRIYAGGPGFATFKDIAYTDKYVKLLFAKPESGLEPPYDLGALRQRLPAGDVPVSRTYTVREVDSAAGWLAIDFVVHGDEGVAGRWAAAAGAGDRLVLTGPGGAYAPDPEAGWHLFIGDEAALPAIAAALEALPDHAVGSALIEVHDARDELELRAPTGIDVRWLHRGERPAGTTRLLVDALAELPWREGRVQVFAHGERDAMKSLRDFLLDQRGLERAQMSLSAYWAHGRAEDRFQAEKREAVGQV